MSDSMYPGDDKETIIDSDDMRPAGYLNDPCARCGQASANHPSPECEQFEWVPE